MDTANPVISVVIPVFNEGASLRELFTRLVKALESMGRPFEIVMVDDGSEDNSVAILRELRAKDNRLRVIRLSRNFGQSPALYAGFAAVRGSYVVMMDADLQNFPEDIPKLVAKLEEGVDLHLPSYVPNTYAGIDELAAMMRSAYRRFYMRPKYMARALWRARNPVVLRNYLDAFRYWVSYARSR